MSYDIIALEVSKYVWVMNTVSYYALDEHGILCYKPDDIKSYRVSNVSFEELLEHHKTGSIRAEYAYLITDKKEIAKFLMTRELLK